MLRVTVEIVPYGIEEMSRTISEICIANTKTQDGQANYEAAGYIIHTDNKIEDFAATIENYTRQDGALKLVAEIINTPRKKFDEVELAEQLIQKTRLNAQEEK